MSKFQAETLRRLIDAYGDLAREVGKVETDSAQKRAEALRRMDEAREKLDMLLAVMTWGRK